VADRRAQGLSSRGNQQIERTLLLFENPLISATLKAYREFEDELARQFPEDTPRLGRVLESGSWVGGDQDGNPFVESEMITTALGLHREIIIERRLASAVWLADHMSQCAGMIPVFEDLRRSVERNEKLMPGLVGRYRGIDPNEVYRRKLLVMSERLRLALGQPGAPSAYSGVSEFLDDLFKIRDSLLQNGGVRVAEGRLRDLIRQAEVFGFHLAKLDVRQESSTVVRAVAHLVSASTGEDLLAMDEAARAALLRRLLADPGLSLPEPEEVSEETRKVLETFWRIRHAKGKHSGTPVETFILSMARSASDVLSVQLLARRAGLLEVEEGGRFTANSLSQGHAPL
jgi:phosphoenolpyruvate carboxylase